MSALIGFRAVSNATMTKRAISSEIGELGYLRYHFIAHGKYLSVGFVQANRGKFVAASLTPRLESEYCFSYPAYSAPVRNVEFLL
jgi:hypothetical protein